MSSTEEVLNHHLDAFGQQDMERTMSDYAEDAVLISRDGVLRGRDEIRHLFADLFEEFSANDVSFSLEHQTIEGEYAYIVWNAETPETEYELASDTFVVRDGEIVAQTLVAQTSSKP